MDDWDRQDYYGKEDEDEGDAKNDVTESELDKAAKFAWE